MVRRTLILTLALLGAATSLRAAPPCPDGAAWPPPFRLQFDVTASRSFLSLSGDNTLTLTRSSDGYLLVSETSASVWFTARQSSRGRIGRAGLVPTEYMERNSRKPQMSTHLDWQRERVTFSASDNVIGTAPLMQDRLSLLLQIGWTLRARPATAVIELPVAGVRGSSIYRFEARGIETINTPLGHLQAAKYERPMDEDDDRLEVWIAPALCGLPVRVRFADHKGQVIENQLKSAYFD